MLKTADGKYFACWLALIAVWIIYAGSQNLWPAYALHWPVALTMVFGSFIAGSTSEGGGAIAFPVFTLLLGLSPALARDFSLFIQTAGMGMATVMILSHQTQLARNVLLPVITGGALGIYFGVFKLAPLLSPPTVKIFFVSIWIGFAAVLIYSYRSASQHRARESLRLDLSDNLLLLVVGFIGGVVSGLTGSGIDMVTFSVLVLLYRLDLRIAVPTSVCLMFLNSATGAIYLLSSGQYQPDALVMAILCVPIVTIGAPFGARFIKGRSSHFIYRIVTLLCVGQYFTALIILRPGPTLLTTSFSIIFAALAIFFLLYQRGLKRQTQKRNVDNDQAKLGMEETQFAKE